MFVKVVILGDASVGKTSLRRRWMGESFKKEYIPTLGASFGVKTIIVKTNEINISLKFQIWDLAGHPTFQAVRAGYYKGALGAFILYDITNTKSYQNIPYWIKELFKNNEEFVTPFILLGNKIDLRNEISDTLRPEHGLVYSKQLSEVTQPYGFKVPYLETSAKTGENVDQAFQLLGKMVINYRSLKKAV